MTKVFTILEVLTKVFTMLSSKKIFLMFKELLLKLNERLKKPSL